MEDFIKIPNLPQNDVTLVAIDCRARKSILETLDKMNIEILGAGICEDLYESVAGHPDMFMHHLGGRDIVVAPNAPMEIIEGLSKHGFNLIKGHTSILRKYPYDIAYNVARIDRYAVCNKRYTDKVLLQYLHDSGIKIVDIKQGYAKCSICIVGNSAVVTSDEGVYKALSGIDIDVLKIECGSITLEGLDHGFIGGASGYISKDALSFAGNLIHHPNFYDISKFLKKYNSKIKNLDEHKLMDVGTIIPLKEKKTANS